MDKKERHKNKSNPPESEQIVQEEQTGSQVPEKRRAGIASKWMEGSGRRPILLSAAG